MTQATPFPFDRDDPDAPRPKLRLVETPALTPAPCEATCPACGYHVAVPFLPRSEQPLATVAWPASAATARAMERLPLAFVSCVDCGHVFNAEFDYAKVPYSQKPNLMFNRGRAWAEHIDRTCDWLLERLPDAPVVVEIGAGEGHLLRRMAQRRPRARCIGFDPSGVMDTGGGLFEARHELFAPSRHLAELQPDVVISRHVLEHLVNPLGFVQSIDFAASWSGIEAMLFIEVPCIDRVFETGRIADFYYEHNSHFTQRSFQRMLERSTAEVRHIDTAYGGEVIFGLARLGGRGHTVHHAQAAQSFADRSTRNRARVQAQLDEMTAAGRCIAIWGGTGKAAAFMNYFALDAERFPLVVDSDPDKVGTFVPGLGQRIESRDALREHAVDAILIPMQWRARDIEREMLAADITCHSILIEHDGDLVELNSDDHPY